MEKTIHKTLPCGIEFGCVELPDRHAVAIEFRIFSGTAHEPDDKLGVARLLQETIDLGTENFEGRALSDAFDEIGASHSGWVGREAAGYSCFVLPEFVERAIELHAEYLRRPTFPEDKVSVAIDLTRQEWSALHDDAQSLADKIIGAQAYGKYLGRHALGTPESLEKLDRKSILDHWTNTYGAGRMQVVASGAIDADRLADLLEKHFGGYGSPSESGRDIFEVEFDARRIHHDKEAEQQQIAIAFRGTSLDRDDYPAQRVMLGVLSGGMSSRLFTEVREKQGLVYWVSAWGEYPRGSGMIFLGASTKPDRCHETYDTLLREVDRVGKDLTDEELKRAATGMVAKREMQGDMTRSRCGELADDLFHFRRPRDRREKIERIKRVTVKDIQNYLDAHPRDALSVVTLGPRRMEGTEVADGTKTEGVTA